MVAGGLNSAGAVNTVDFMGANGSFTPGPPMLQARANAACTMLQDGRVFVSGGTSGQAALATAELFTPSTGAWTDAGSMSVARYGHTHTVTSPGAVLLIGGRNDNGVSDVVEAFRPLNNSFTVLGKLSSSRTDYAVTVIDQHRTLIAGGTDGNATLSTLDIFDSNTNKITSAGTMRTARSSFAAVTLFDGTVMFIGGYDQSHNAVASTEIYDPNTMTSVPGPGLSSPRAGHQAYALPGNGTVILVGGTDGTKALSTTDAYEPWTGRWTPKGAMQTARMGLATSLMSRGGLIAAGGRNSSGYLAGAEAYAFATAETDKSDYHPGEVATFTGSGWMPGESVTFTVTAFPADAHSTEFTGTAVADATGKVRLRSFNIDQSHLGMKFLLNAAGSQSQAELTFTDATPDPTSVTGTTNPANGYAYGQYVSFNITVNDLPPAAHGAPFGTITISDNNITTATVAPANLVPSDAYSGATTPYNVYTDDGTGILSPGVHNFQVAFHGNASGNWSDSLSSIIPFTVSQMSTVTTLIPPGAQTIGYGAQATLRATVTTQADFLGFTYGKPPTGALIFTEGNPPSYLSTCTGVIIAQTATQSTYECKTSTTLGVNGSPHLYAANYTGIDGIWGSSNTGNNYDVITVSPIDTTIALTANPITPTTYPAPTTLTAVVTPVAGGPPAGNYPDGWINFKDNGVVVCANALLDATATAHCTTTFNGGNHPLTAEYVIGPSGNYKNTTPGVLNPYVVNPAPTTTSLNLLVSPSASYGTSQTLTATVSCTVVSCGPPTGTVTFYDALTGGLPLVGCPTGINLGASGMNGVAVCTTTSIPAASNLHHITAAYTPGPPIAGNWAASTSSDHTYQVTGIAPQFTIGVVPGSPTAFQSLTFSLTANPIGGNTPTGQVQLVIDTQPVGGFINLNNGAATFNTSGYANGTHNLAINYTALATEVNYVTTPNVVPNPASFVVGATATTATVTSNLTSPILYGTPVTFTATVAPVGTGGTPAGTVQFYDNGTTPANALGSPVTVSGGVANLAFPPNTYLAASPGGQNHAIYAKFSSTDTNYSDSPFSSSFNMMVNPANTTTTVSPSVSSLNLGQQVTYTAAVTVSPTTAGSPSGTLAITDNGVTIPGCTLTLVLPSCTVTYNGTTPLTAGTHSIVVTFTHTSANFADSTSAPATVTVAQAATTIGPLSTIPTGNPGDPAVYNNAPNSPSPMKLKIPFTFGVSGPPYAKDFQVYDGLTLIGTQPVTNPSPDSFDIPASVYRMVGAHTFTVKYPTGDPNYAAATSTGVTLNIAKFTPTVSINPTTANVLFSTALTLGAQIDVSGAGTGAAVATGTLTFSTGSTTLGTCTLDLTGKCSINTANVALVAPSDTITVAYSGDANYNSNSSTTTQTIIVNSVSIGVTTSPVTMANLNTAVILKATVTANNNGIGIPAGTVTFWDAFNSGTAAPIGTSALVNGVAILSTSNLQAGPHVISAEYSGFPVPPPVVAPTTFAPLAHDAAGVTPANLAINTGNTTVSITPSATSIALGPQSMVTYYFTVTGGNTPPAGNVTLIDLGGAITNSGNGTCSDAVHIASVGTGNSNSGSCTMFYNSQDPVHGPGAHSLYFHFASDNTGNWADANSPSAIVTVGATAATIDTPTATPGPGLVYLQTTTLSTTVHGTSGTPTGTVSFYDGTTFLGNSTLSGGVANLGPASYPVGSHTFTAKYNGDANYGSITSGPLPVTVTKNGTATGLSAPSTQTYGVSQTLTATVTIPTNPAGTPSGTVTFWAGSTNLGTGTLVCAAQCQATTTLVNQLSPGSYTLTATYSGDSNFSGSTSGGSTTVVGPNTVKITMATSPSGTASLNTAVIIRATVAAASGVGTPTGSVNFWDYFNGSSSATSLGTSTLVNGVAILSTSNLQAGGHILSADFTTDGTGNYQSIVQPNAAITNASLTVAAGNTTVSITPSATSIVLGLNSTVTYSFTVTGGNTPPAGSVVLSDTAGPITNSANGTCANPVTFLSVGTGNSTSGSCTVIYNGLDAAHLSGTHLLTFAYTSSNITNWSNATSATAQVVVTTGTATLDPLQSSAGLSLVYNQPTNISVTVHGSSGGPLPAGKVNFFDGATLLNAVPISLVGNPTVATLSGGIYAVGTHTITAQFLGDTNYSAVTSAPIIITTTKDGTATGLVGPSTQTYGFSQTLTATVTPNSVPGGSPGVPTGTVTFWAGSVNLGTGTLSCAATCQATTTLVMQLSPASYSLTAVYSGDANFSSSTSLNTVNTTVNPNFVTEVLSTSPAGTANLNTSVVIRATVAAAGGGGGVPTGSVKFYDAFNGGAATLIGTSQLVNGVALLSNSNLQAGPHVFTSDFITDSVGNFATLLQPQTNPPITPASLTVIAGNTTITITPSVSTIALGPSATVTYTYTVTGGNTPPAGTIQLLDTAGTISNSSNGSCVGLLPLSGGSGNTTSGFCTVTYNGADAAHGAGVHVLDFQYKSSNTALWSDGTSPAVQVTVTSTPATIDPPQASPAAVVYLQSTTITAAVHGSGPAPTGNVNFYDGVTLLSGGPFPLVSGTATLPANTYSVGTHSISARYLGDSNYSPVTSLPTNLIVSKNATATSVSAPASQTYGIGATLTATVTIPLNPNGTPTGTVTFMSGATTIGTGTLSCSGGCTATTTLINQLVPGSTYPLTATYNGDGNFLASTSNNASSVQVQKNGVTQSLTPSPLNTASFGQTVILTAVFGPAASGSGTPTGTVTFYDLAPGSSAPAFPNYPPQLGTATLNGSGVATLSTSSLIPGDHTLSASYGGDVNFNASPWPGITAPLKVVQGNTTVTLTPSSNPASLNQTITYNVTVTGGPSQPLGTVILNDGLAGGAAIPGTCQPITLTPASGNTSTGSCTVLYNASDTIHGIGSHPITAVYTHQAGTTNWQDGVSSVVTEVVGKVQPSMSAITVTGSVGSTCLPQYCFPYGTTFSFAVTMTPATPNPPYSAPVIYTVNGVAVGQAAISTVNGVATLSNVLLNGGNNTITASFPGDANYLSDPVTVTIVITKFVLQKDVSETLSGPSQTVTYGGVLPSNPAVLNVTFAKGCGVCAVPTGTVNVYAGPANLLLGTYTIDPTGVANISVPSLPAALSAGANQNMSFIYSGDANYAPPSPQLSALLTVNRALPTITATSSPNPSNFNQNVTFVSNVTFPVGQPTGTVAFVDNGTTLTSTALLVGGTASYQIANLQPGTHPVTATYNGDNNFLGVSISSAIQQVVQAGNVTLTVTPSTATTAINTSVVYTIVASSAAGAPQGTVILYDAITSPPTALATCLPPQTLTTITPPVNPPSSSVTCTVNYNSTTANSVYGSGTHVISAQYAPPAGNVTWTTAGSPAVTVTVGKSPVSISQPTANPTPGTYGAFLTYAVTLTPSNPSPAYAAGTVQFYDNGSTIGGPVNVVTTAGQSVASVGSIVPVGGSHNITAQFIGDSNYNQSAMSASLVFNIAKATPTVVSGATNPQSVPYFGTLTLGVSSVTIPAGNNGVQPTGSVTLVAGSTVLGTGTLDGNGQHTFNVQMPASLVVGSYQLAVQYGGDGNWAATSSPFSTLNVTTTATTATVTSPNIPPASASNPIYGQTLTFLATFTGPGNPVAGNVVFQNNGATIGGCGNVVVANNLATCTINTLANYLPVGQNNVTVTSLQDTNHTLASSAVTPTGNFLVVVDPTVTTLISTPNPSLPGQAVVLTATVTVPAPGFGGTGSLAGGTVTFVLNSTPAVNLCTGVALNTSASGATAGCTVPAGVTSPFTAFGPYIITATYNPVGQNATTAASTSAGLTQTVSKPQPIFLTLTSDNSPSQYGQPVTFKTTFGLPTGSSTAPTGKIQFYDGPNSLGSLQNIAQSGSIYTSSITVPSGSLSVLSGGQHVISATYVPGDNDNYGSANSATQQPTPVTFNQQVSLSSVTITLQPETYVTQGIQGAPVYAEWITFTGIIAPANGSTGIPTGSAVFKDAGSQIGPVITLGAADPVTHAVTVSLTTSKDSVINLGTGAAGHPNITLTYLGDSNFAPLTSPTVFANLVISPAPTKTVLNALPVNPAYGTQITLSAKVCATVVNPAALSDCIPGGNPFPGLKGTVTFYDNGLVLNPGNTPVPVDNTGSASITFTATAPPLLNNATPQAAASAVGGHKISAVYSGDANFATSTSGVPTVDNMTVQQGSTKSSVTSSAVTTLPDGTQAFVSVVGQTVTFTGQVFAPGSFAAPPTGTITFYDGGQPLGTATLSVVSGVSSASFTVPNTLSPVLPLTLGQHIISVAYSGDANYTASSTPQSPVCVPGSTAPCALVHTVKQAITTTTISSNNNGALQGQPIILTATVNVVPPGAPVLTGPNNGPTGTVLFYDNVNVPAGSLGTVLGTGILSKVTVSGSSIYQATLSIANIPTGGIAIWAAYSGDVNYLPSTSDPLNQSISKLQSNINLSSNLNSSTLGQPVTFTITITPLPPGSGTATGDVHLFDGSNMIADLTLVGGQTSYTANLPAGNHGIQASYSGDINFQPTVSTTLTQVVNKISSTLNLTSSVPVGAVASQVITFTAQIQPTPPVGVAYPVGQIGFFMDGGTQIGAASLASGVAALSTTLPAGNHQIQAFYLGDTSWTGAQSIYLAQVVGTAVTTTQIVSSANPSVFGQSVTLTISVAVPYPGTVPATGTVQLYDNGNALGTPLPANNGSFSTTLTSLAPGTHSIIAQFQANGSFSQSSSAALSQIVNKAPTVTTLASFPSSSTSKQTVTMTAVVVVPTPGAGNLTGTVQFVNTSTSTVLGTAPLTLIGGVWTATLSTSALNQGSQIQLLTATYSGDGNFASSTSTPQGVSVYINELSVVNAAGYTGTNLAPDSFASAFGSNLSYTALTATTTPLPSSLGGTTVTVTDSAGTARLAPLYYVSLSQINFLIPTNTAFGLATVTVTNASGQNASTIVLITNTAPGLYSENASGQGVPAGFLQRVHADGTQDAQVPLFQYDPNQKLFVPVPIDMSVSTDQLYLVLYGTGIRYGSKATTASMNGTSVPVLYAGAQPQFLGEDQVNLGPIPQSLKGAGPVNVVIAVNGQSSNTVTIQVK